jgi:ABC-2 type transport system permease protein
MIGRPGSTVWLLGCEMRLAWRGAVSGRRGRTRLILIGVLAVLMLAGGLPIAMAVSRLEIPVNHFSILAADAATILIFTLMLSQTLAGGIEALYTRGDLDLLFSSPLSPRKVLTVRFASLAAMAFAAFATLAAPFLIPLALVGHWRWLAFFVALAALALAASAAGLALAVGLFRLIGPRRTRVVAQILAALIGAAFFLVSQIRTLLGAKAGGVWLQVAASAGDPALRLPAFASWPLRAMLGEPAPLAGMVGAGALLFFGVSAWLSQRFAADAAAAQGADVGIGPAARRPIRAFTAGAFAATFVKELRLLRRDVALLAQVLLRVLYMLPAVLVLMRSAGRRPEFELAGGAALLAFLAGQVASSLTWITVSAEDAPELLACAPSRPQTVRNAKLAAGLTPLAAMLAIPLVFLLAVAPRTGIAATLGCTASAVAAGLINAWHPSPGKRTEFRRRRTGSLLIAWALLIVSVLIAGATLFGALGWPVALGPAVLAGLALLALRRSPDQIALALAEG